MLIYRFIIALILLCPLLSKGQVILNKPSSSACLGSFDTISFQTSLIYDSVAWVDDNNNYFGGEDTLILTPSILQMYDGNLGTITVTIYLQNLALANQPLYVFPTKPDFTINVNNDTSTCINDSLEINVEIQSTTGGTPPATVKWYSTDPTFVPPFLGTTKTIKVFNPGKYWAEAQNASQTCTLADTLTFRKIKQPIDLGPDRIVCEDQNVFLWHQTNNNDVTGTRYQWRLNGTLQSTTQPELFALQTGTYRLTSLSPSPQNCTFSDEIRITINPIPTVGLSSNKLSICPGEDVVIQNTASNSGLTYQSQWSGPSLPSPSSGIEVINVNTPGKYKLVLSTNDCSASDSIEIIANSVFSVDLGNDIPDTCFNGSFTLFNRQAQTEPANAFYLWTGPSGNFTTSTIKATKKGMHRLTVTGNGCPVKDSIYVGINPIPTFDLGQDVTTDESFYVFDGSFNGRFNNSFTFLWENTIMDTIFSTTKKLFLDEPGTYDVLLQITNDITGCSSQDQFVITIPEEPIIASHVLYIPDALAPNSEVEDNTVLKIQGPDVANENFEFTLFNRWGQVIFESSDYAFMKAQGWDGRDNSGEEAPLSTYTYTTKGQFIDGEAFQASGTITVIR